MRSIVLLAVFLTACALPAAAAPTDKWFVCKYTGTPGVDEVLQTGQNPISVSESAIPVSPVAPGLFFADSQGRSLVLEADTGQAEPAAECPTTLPTATPSPSALPSQLPSPSSLPSEPPTIEPFSVSVCPVTGEVPAGMSAIRFDHPLLLLAVLNVRVDGQLVTLAAVLGDGTVGDVLVTPGVHSWSVSNAADTEVLAAGEVDCPECNPAPLPTPVLPAPDETPLPAPSPGLPDTAAGG